MPDQNRIRTASGPFLEHHVADGIPVQSVYSMLQDSTGFVWVGTQRGLIRLAGNDVRRFQPDSGSAHSIPGKFIIALGEGEENDIWIGTHEAGSARFDPISEQFSPLDIQPLSESDNIVRAFQRMGDGRMWIATHGSLTAFDPATGHVSKFRHPDVDDPLINVLHQYRYLLPLDDFRLLVGTGAGLFRFDVRTEAFHQFRFDDRGISMTFRRGILAMTRAHDALIAATAGQLYRIDPDREELILMEPLLTEPDQENQFIVNALAADSVPGRIWVATSYGLLRLEGEEKYFDFYRPDDGDPHKPAGIEILSLMRDRSDMLWIGTGASLSLLDLRYNFEYHRVHDGSGQHTLTVSDIERDDGGTFWLATPAGLVEHDIVAGRYDHYSLGKLAGHDRQESGFVREIHRGKEYLWVASDYGLFQWDWKNRSIVNSYYPKTAHQPPADGKTLLARYIKGIFEDSHGFLWCGSDAAGMQRLDPATGTFRYYRKGDSDDQGIPYNTMITVLEDRRGRLWFGFALGFARYDRELDRFESFLHDPADPASLSNNMVIALHEDSAGRIWVGTASGLNRVEEGNDGSLRFKSYGLKDGLPVDFIVSIVEHDGELWLGTDRGIVRFKENGDHITARLYDRSDGLHSPGFALNSAISDAEGFLYFGGEYGFSRFHPAHVRPDTAPPRVVITEFRLFNQLVPVVPPGPEGNNSILSLDRSITHTRSLRLSYRHSVITFRYAALHYRQTHRIRYAYKLEGFDREWIDAGTRTEVTYTNLDPGDYVLRVRAFNSDGVPSEHPAELRIRMDPPPWRTWWAHLLYGAAGVGAIASFTRWRIALREREMREQRRVEQVREEERESLRRQNASDFHDEAGTTLTRILFLTELARRRSEGDADLREMLEKIDANASRLSQGMRDFIWVLDPDKDTLLDTLQRIDALGQSLFSHSESTFSMQYDHLPLQSVRLDPNSRRQILMICKEALHNALRHSGAGTITVGAERLNGHVRLTIVDNGRGFDPANGNAGYGLKSMATRAGSIDAELNVVSQQSAGTRIELKIPHMSD